MEVFNVALYVIRITLYVYTDGAKLRKTYNVTRTTLTIAKKKTGCIVFQNQWWFPARDQDKQRNRRAG